MRKALGELARHVRAHGLIRGTRIAWLKSRGRSGFSSISSAITGGRVWVRPGTSDMAIYDQIVLQPYLPRHLAPEVIVDCGANIGLTVRYLNAAYPLARIIAVEPAPDNFGLLLKNIHGITNIQAVRAGIWPSQGRLGLRTEGLRPSSFRTVASDTVGEVEALTIPIILERFGIDRISLLKIDIEGSELELFTGDVRWIERVGAIAIELHDAWRPGCGDAFFRAIAPWDWRFSFHGGAVLCEKRGDQLTSPANIPTTDRDVVAP